LAIEVRTHTVLNGIVMSLKVIQDIYGRLMGQWPKRSTKRE
jgi:hypothetical protein